MKPTDHMGVTVTEQPKFDLIYATSKSPKTRHLDERCWTTVEYRKATPDEMKAIEPCKHCVRRAEHDAAQAAKPAAKPLPRHPGKADIESARVTA